MLREDAMMYGWSWYLHLLAHYSYYFSKKIGSGSINIIVLRNCYTGKQRIKLANDEAYEAENRFSVASSTLHSLKTMTFTITAMSLRNSECNFASAKSPLISISELKFFARSINVKF